MKDSFFQIIFESPPAEVELSTELRCREIMKSNDIIPEPSGVKPANENSILLKKNSRTTLSGSIHANNSPNNVPKRVPKNKIKMIILIERLFIA